MLSKEHDYKIAANLIENGGGWIITFLLGENEAGRELVTIPHHEHLNTEEIDIWQGYLFEDALAIATAWLISEADTPRA